MVFTMIYWIEAWLDCLVYILFGLEDDMIFWDELSEVPLWNSSAGKPMWYTTPIPYYPNISYPVSFIQYPISSIQSLPSHPSFGSLKQPDHQKNNSDNSNRDFLRDTESIKIALFFCHEGIKVSLKLRKRKSRKQKDLVNLIDFTSLW